MDTRQAFEDWWDKHGQYVRAGGGQYEVSFAYAAWQAATERERERAARICEESTVCPFAVAAAIRAG